MAELTQEQKDVMWDQMDMHTAYLKGEMRGREHIENPISGGLGDSYDNSIFFITRMLDEWNYIGERDVTKYLAVLSVTTRKDLETQAAVNKQSREYLASTDWYIIRKSDTGVAIPADILTKRAEARVAVIE